MRRCADEQIADVLCLARGRHSWSGQHATTKDGDGPFTTISRAQQALRIPLAAVGIDYAMGIKLGFNIGVRRLETGEWICWWARARRTGSWMGLGDSCWSRGSTLYSAWPSCALIFTAAGGGGETSSCSIVSYIVHASKCSMPAKRRRSATPNSSSNCAARGRQFPSTTCG